MAGRLSALAVSIWFVATPANAKTGAELLQDNDLYGLGFVWGAVNYMATHYTTNEIDNRLTSHRAKCFIDSGVTAKTMYDAVIREIQSDPRLLSMNATNALVSVTYKMCGPPPN